MKTLLTITFFFCCLLGISAQQIVQDDLGINNPNLQASRGTYDILIDTTKGFHIVEMTPEILRSIEANRAESTYSYIDIAPSIKVRIHPRTNPSTNPINTVRDEE